MEHEDQVARGWCRGREWVRVSRGLHRRADAADPFRAELAAWQLALPASAAFSGLTAARVRRWDLPPVPDALPVMAAMPYGATAPTRPGRLRVTRHRHPPPYQVVDGLRVTSVAETILTSAPVLGVLDLVVLLDSALRAGDVELLELWMLAGRRRRGVRTLRRALRLVDAGAESVMESLLRTLHRVCGLDVRSQVELRDVEGNLVARGDLWLVGTTTLQEYDGGHHADRDQQRADRRRDRRINRVGWTRNGYVDVDVLRRPVTVLADADRAVRRPHRPERIRGFTVLLRGSVFTPAGVAALRDRLGSSTAGGS